MTMSQKLKYFVFGAVLAVAGALLGACASDVGTPEYCAEMND